jgi:hypothetical protein
MKSLIALAACLMLGGCYQDLAFGPCQHEDVTHHTEHDFGGIGWCRSGPGSQTASSHWLD